MNLWHIIFFIFYIIFLIESSKIPPNFDEIFGQGWAKKESEEIMIKIEQNERNENSQSEVDQMGEEMGNDPKNVKINHKINDEAIDQQKREIVKNFDAIREKLREKRKFKSKDRVKIETKIAKLLGTNRKLIQKLKNELNLNKSKMKKRFYEQKKSEFIERFDEFKELYGQGKQKEFVKELGISQFTFIKWKKELMPNYHKSQKHHTIEDKLEKMKQYFEIKEANPKMSDKIIAKELGIGYSTLIRWKKECLSI